MSEIAHLLAFALQLYLYLLIARLVIEWIQMLARDWRPSGPVLVLVEGVYTLTDPPVRALRSAIPPLRVGGVALDLSFIVLLIAIQILIGVLYRL